MTANRGKSVSEKPTSIIPNIQAYRNIIVQVIQSSLEEIGFMEILPVEEQSPYDESIDRYRADILIEDPHAGEIQLIMPRTVLEIIAENVYTMEKQEISDEILNDIISEMINIIAGSLMRLWTPPSQIFKLGLPSVGQEAFLQIDITKDSLEFDMEGSPFWLVMRGEVFMEPPAGN
jgi:CheY-specific phosphatase CheX